MVSHTGPTMARSNFFKGPYLTWKNAKRKFWGQQMLFGTKFLKVGLKWTNLPPWARCSFN